MISTSERCAEHRSKYTTTDAMSRLEAASYHNDIDIIILKHLEQAMISLQGMAEF